MGTADTVAPGDVIAGKYRVDRVLGKGGMGMVVAATHIELLEPRAIKLMLPHVAENADHAARFLREARIAARLKSEHAARVFDMGRTEAGVPYMVMEYLEGEDLASLVKRGVILSPYDCALYVLQASDALAEAHSVGLVHRDIKHQNLFLTRGHAGEPCIKVLDFGISRTSTVDDQVTVTGEVLGTPLYMSPEQMQAARDLDGRADIWSLGVLLYWLLTRQYPFPAREAVALIAMVTGNHPVIPPSALRLDVPPLLDAAIMRCLQRDRAMRPATVAELARLLLPLVPGSELLVQRIEKRLGISEMAPISSPPASGPMSAPTSMSNIGPITAPMTAPMMAPSIPIEYTDKVWQSATGAVLAPRKKNPAWVLPAIFAIVAMIFGVGIFMARRILAEPVETNTATASIAAPAATTNAAPIATPVEQPAPAVAGGVVEPAPAVSTAAPAVAPTPRATKKSTRVDRHTF